MIVAQRTDDGRFIARFRFDQFWQTVRRRDGLPRTYKAAPDARRAAHREYLERFAALLFVNEDGTAALEAAIVLPGLIFLAGAFFALAAAFMQASACQYAAQASAYQAVHFGEQAAQQTATANAALFMFSTPSITVAQSGDQWTATCTSSMPSLFPGLGPFATTATATD
jgi:hypothetical protein